MQMMSPSRSSTLTLSPKDALGASLHRIGGQRARYGDTGDVCIVTVGDRPRTLGPFPHIRRSATECFGASQEVIVLVGVHPRPLPPQPPVMGEHLILQVDLRGYPVVSTAVVHAHAQVLGYGKLHQTECLLLAARNGNAAAVAVLVRILVRVLAQLEAAPEELFGLVQWEAELQEIDAPHPNRVGAPHEAFQLVGRVRDDRYFYDHVGKHVRRPFHHCEDMLLVVVEVQRLHAETDLVQTRGSKLFEGFLVPSRILRTFPTAS